MWSIGGILAQKPGANWSDLLYLLVFLILPALNHLGEWIRKKFNTEETSSAGKDSAGKDEGKVYEVTVGKNDELVLRPAAPPHSHASPSPVPVRTHLAAPAPPGSTMPTPVGKPAPQHRPAARPLPKPPPPARAHPAHVARQHHSQPARTAYQQVAQAVESHSLLDEAAVETLLLEEDEPRHDHAHELIAHEPFDARSLQKAFVLCEILTPPLAIRPPGANLFSQLE